MADLKVLPYIDYVRSDKSMYPFACDTIDRRTGKTFIDDDKDFKIGNTGGFLMNIDFKFINTHLFNEVATRFESNKDNPDIINWVNSLEIDKTENRNKYYYCPHVKSSPEYRQFWTREVRRRRNGMTAKCKLLSTGEIVDLHITGDQYNYLNYSIINRTPTDEEREELNAIGDFKTELIPAFPRFWDGDYWNFKIDLFIARNNYHLAKGKARGKGYSYKRGSQAANTLNLVKKASVVLAADLIDYLTDADATASMVKTNLDWLEDNTHWRRGYLSEDLEELRLGFKTKTGGSKQYGVLSKLFSVSLHTNESAAIGKRAIEIDFEEAGKCPNLEAALGVTLSSTEVGAGNVGTIRVYGTAGTKEANWAGFANVFYTPAKYKMMPFENVWDYNGRNRTCGFFHPQVLNYEPFMDIDGNSLLEEAYEYDRLDKERQLQVLPSSEYILYVGQRANTPEEAFKRGGENIFTSPELSDHYSRILADDELRYYRDGMIVQNENGLEFVTNKQFIADGKPQYAHPYIEEVPFNAANDFYGCIREYYPPHKINGITPEGLYAVVYDTVGKDKKSDLVINKNSLNSIYVVMFPNDITRTRGNIIVAAYSGRPESMAQADRIALNMTKRYNARLLVETDRGETVSNFRKWRELKWLFKDPTVYLSGKLKEALSVSYGMSIGSGSNAMDGLMYLKDLLYDKIGEDEQGNNIYTFHYVYDIPFLKELMSFNINDNFDRISSMRLYTFLLKALQTKRKSDILKTKTNRVSIHEEIGLYGYTTN